MYNKKFTRRELLNYIIGMSGAAFASSIIFPTLKSKTVLHFLHLKFNFTI